MPDSLSRDDYTVPAQDLLPLGTTHELQERLGHTLRVPESDDAKLLEIDPRC